MLELASGFKSLRNFDLYFSFGINLSILSWYEKEFECRPLDLHFLECGNSVGG